MNDFLYAIIGIIIPFIGTSIGSSFVFFIKNEFNKKIEKLLIGFAIGVMISASFFSLIIPSIELSSNYKYIWLPTSIGFALGFVFLIFIKKYTSHKDMLSLSVLLHNLPEGMAVGVVFASFLSGGICLMEAFIVSLGIAIQNIPEGSIISMPQMIKGKTKGKSFINGVLSGMVEPISAFITILLTKLVVPFMPYFLSFAAGCMIFVVINELSFEMHEEKNQTGIIGVMIGFIIMMILDIALS